jgi:hypothetical protein
MVLVGSVTPAPPGSSRRQFPRAGFGPGGPSANDTFPVTGSGETPQSAFVGSKGAKKNPGFRRSPDTRRTYGSRPSLR